LGADGLFEIFLQFRGTGTKITTTSVPVAVISRAMRPVMDTSPYVFGVSPGWIDGIDSTGTPAGQQTVTINSNISRDIQLVVSNFTSNVYVKSLVIEQYKGNFQENI
jgi:hypothetical protein